MKSSNYLLILVISLQLISCGSQSSTQASSSLLPSDKNTVEHSILSEVVESEDQHEDEWITKYPELIIYPLNSYEKTEGQTTGFIPLTDSYPWTDHKDSISISPEYLGNNEIKDFHVLSPKYRTRFLNIMKIKETDKVFIYNFRMDSIHTFSVKDLPLLAHITIYGADAPISQHDYLIGFDLQNALQIKDYSDYYDALVYVGAENPFQKGKIKPIIWKKMDANQFPKDVQIKHKSKINKLYKFQMNDLDYYLLNENQLVIIDKSIGKVISETIFEEGESASLAELSFTHKKNEYTPQQWTGNLFKNKPPVYFGFLYESFGCTSINFIEKQANSIYIHCDNRH